MPNLAEAGVQIAASQAPHCLHTAEKLDFNTSYN
jgi:hypothetical protein